MTGTHPESIDPESESVGTGPDGADPDEESDPSLDDGRSADWTPEGGATDIGPATHSGADDA